MAQDIDKDWFMSRLSIQGKSLRGLAKHLDIDASAASRMLSGERRMKMEEASRIAIFLGATVADVLKHAGVAIDASGNATRIILAASVDEKGHIARLIDPKPLPEAIIKRAKAAISIDQFDRGEQIIAAQIRADAGPLAIWDDAVILFKHTDAVDPSAIGALSVCRLRSGAQIVGKIERARKTGEARIVGPAGDIHDELLSTATPIIAVIP